LLGCNQNEKGGSVQLKVLDGNKYDVKEYRSLEKALIASREYPENSGKTIVLGKGDYYLSETIALGAEDAGLTIEGESKEEVRIIAGKQISNWEKGEGDFLVAKLQKNYSIPIIDISGETFRHVIIDRDSARYFGHPSTLLMEDGKTMFSGYTINDGGQSWSDYKDNGCRSVVARPTTVANLSAALDRIARGMGLRLPPIMLEWVGPDYITREELAIRGYDVPCYPYSGTEYS